MLVETIRRVVDLFLEDKIKSLVYPLSFFFFLLFMYYLFSFLCFFIFCVSSKKFEKKR
jgi:hypothetical protein